MPIYIVNLLFDFNTIWSDNFSQSVHHINFTKLAVKMDKTAKCYSLACQWRRMIYWGLQWKNEEQEQELVTFTKCHCSFRLRLLWNTDFNLIQYSSNTRPAQIQNEPQEKSNVFMSTPTIAPINSTGIPIHAAHWSSAFPITVTVEPCQNWFHRFYEI
jgi:hypothetical protein